MPLFSDPATAAHATRSQYVDSKYSTVRARRCPEELGKIGRISSVLHTRYAELEKRQRRGKRRAKYGARLSELRSCFRRQAVEGGVRGAFFEGSVNKSEVEVGEGPWRKSIFSLSVHTKAQT